MPLAYHPMLESDLMSIESLDAKSAGWIVSVGVLALWFIRGLSLGFKLGGMHADIKSMSARLGRIEDHLFNQR